MKRIAILTAALAALSQTAAAAPILPGYWESTNEVTFPIASQKTERKCITADLIENYLSGPSNNHYTCHYAERHIENGQMTMSGDCVDNNGLPSKIKVDGVYSPTSFHLNGHLRVMIGQLSVPVAASTDAHRLSAECPDPNHPDPTKIDPPAADPPPR